MRRRTLLAALGLGAFGGAAWAQNAGHDGHGYTAPAPGDLGGAISLRDASGEPFTQAELRGSWSMLYFGYSRCRSACPTALPTLAEAANGLRARGVPARALFVDIEAAPQPVRLRNAPTPAAHVHDPAHDASPFAALAAQFHAVMFLHGSRGQIHQAVSAFRVRAEHVPPRTALGEAGHSINHTTAIYVINPAGAVVGYVYHDVTPAALIAYVEQRARA